MQTALSNAEFVREVIHTHWTQAITPHAGLPSLPIVVGAGVSASSGVPLDRQLRETIARHLGMSEGAPSYEALYIAIQEAAGARDPRDRDDLVMKMRLREALAYAGIPMRKDRPAPNVANLALVHLLQAGLFGPIISLNVDPLLNIAAHYLEKDDPNEVRFVCNASQFSEYIAAHESPRSQGPSSSLERTLAILQVHGSIEEPLSLRFHPDELAGTDSTIAHALGTACAPSRAILCIGTSLQDDAVTSVILKWVERRLYLTGRLTVYAAFYRTAPSERFARIESDVAARFPGYSIQIEFKYTENADADRLLEDLIAAGSQLTKERRGAGRGEIYVPLMPRNSLRARLFAYAGETGEPTYARMPDPARQMMIELILHAVSARGPFTVRDLVKSSPAFVSNSLQPAEDRRLRIRGVLNELVEAGLLAYLHHTFGGWSSDASPPKLASLDEIERVELVRAPTCRRAADFAKRFLSAIRPDGGGGSRTPMDEYVKLLLLLEREAAHSFVPSQAVAALSMFDRPKLLRSHRALEKEMDKIKEECRKAVDRGDGVDCYVVTETGEHLFRPDKIEKDVDWGAIDKSRLPGSPNHAIEELLRPWIATFYSATRPGQRLHLFLAARDATARDLDWKFEDAEFEVYTRKEVDRNVSRLISKLQSDSIFVQYVPWDTHTDHMWYYRAQGQEADRTEGRGIYFPTRFFERLYYGAELNSPEDLQRLDRIRERMLGVYAYPEAELPVSWVLAVTLIDAPPSPPRTPCGARDC